jgi:hypothetical protein
MDINNLQELQVFVDNITWIPDNFTHTRIKPTYEYDIQHLYFPSTPYIRLDLKNVLNENKILFELQKFGFTFYKHAEMSEMINIERQATIVLTKTFDFASFNEVCEGSQIKSKIGISLACPHYESNRDFVIELMTFLINKINDERKDDEHKFYMIAQSNSGLYNIETTCKAVDIKDNRYDLYYGADFPHDKFVEFVTGTTNNFMLLHGDPGTGKSNYIKNLVGMSKRDVIYIPPSMLAAIARPDFVSYMLNNKGKILLIEDAEQVLSVDRNSATNNLLGLTDGFLKDSLDLKVIATMNAPLNQIDPALMRKGRLHFEYKFDKLNVNEARKLAEFLELERTIDKDMTLAEIFNNEDVAIENSFEKKVIGFGAY